ncbi:MAG: hypothetical protein ABIY71_03000 [Flavobacteriales bacterium]
MNKRNSIVIGLFGIAAVALVGLYLSLQHQEEDTASFDVPWTGTEDPDDPFHGLVEEGAGLIGQFKAEAAARMSVYRRA